MSQCEGCPVPESEEVKSYRVTTRQVKSGQVQSRQVMTGYGESVSRVSGVRLGQVRTGQMVS